MRPVGRVIAALCCSVTFAFAPLVASAAGGAITGSVIDSSGAPVSGASIAVSGLSTQRVQSASDGSFSVNALTPGTYRVVVQKTGFLPVTQSDVAVTENATIRISVSLQAISLGALTTIGSVSVNSRNRINISTASVGELSGQQIVDRGLPDLSHALDTIPGFTGAIDGGGFTGGINGAIPATGVQPQIRGALSYETESLIDGHPLAFGAVGFYNPQYLSPYVLQGVEVVKGPGATPANINYAIAGTVNYRTLSPTATDRVGIDESIDSYGGIETNLRATGHFEKKLGYAFDYYVDGTPGPLQNYKAMIPGLPTAFGNVTINGQQVCAAPLAPSNCLGTTGSGPKNLQGATTFQSPLIACCTDVNSNYTARNQFAKIVADFSPATSFTFSYLGVYGLAGAQAGFTYFENNRTFTPGPSYNGPIPAGTVIPCCATAILPYQDKNHEGIYSGELRTTVGPVTLLGRYYTASIDDLAFALPQTSRTLNLALYGTIALGPQATPTTFTGQTAAVTIPYAYFPYNELDQLRGLSLQGDYQAGRGRYTFSYDQVHSATGATQDFGGVDSVVISPSSGQTFTTLRGQAAFAFSDKASLDLSDYALAYTNHVSPDGGTTFVDSRSYYNVPRVSLNLRPSSNISLRFAAGASIAPPYLSLISTSTTPPQNFGGGFYYQSKNSGDVKPETAFSVNAGGDFRVARDTILGLDLYNTNVRNLLLTTTTFAGTYTPPPMSGTGQTQPGPLYISSTGNLGVARYDGIELSARHAPLNGFGGLVNFSLLRAYTYALPAGFYDAGGQTGVANIGSVPNINFQGNSYYYGGISNGRVPYSQGYFETSYRRADRFEALVGATYFGPNNSYNYPAFFVLNASYRQQLSKKVSLQLSANNLLGIYGSTLSDQRQDGPGIENAILSTGLQGQLVGVNQGPPTGRLTLHYQF